MNGTRVTIPSFLINGIKNKINQKYERSLLKKNKIDSYIFLNKKVITILSKYTFLSSLNKVVNFNLNVNDIDNKIFINDTSFIIYGYVEKDEFIYIEKDINQSKYVIVRFDNNLKYSQVIYNSSLENIKNDFDIDLNQKQLKISINKIEEFIKKSFL